ncbi:hypothetical protein [Helicobacter pullorum]|nr:hypothetical protein [Helicobacter pullorum]
MKYYRIFKDKIWNKYGVILGYKKEKSREENKAFSEAFHYLEI